LFTYYLHNEFPSNLSHITNSTTMS